MTTPFSTTNPPGTETPTLGDNRIRELAVSLSEVLAKNHHLGAGPPYDDADRGQHTIVDLQFLAADPTPETGVLKIYSKDTGAGAIEGFLMDAAGNIMQLSRAGDFGILPNEVALQSFDSSGTGTVGLIGASGIDASGDDIVFIAAKARSLAATESGNDALTLVTRGYVDAELSGISFGAKANLDSSNVAFAKDEIYLAGSDGYVVCCSDSLIDNQTLIVFSDSSNPPTAQCGYFEPYLSGSGRWIKETMTIPIKKGDYWKVTCSTTLKFLYWRPLGSGGCVKQ